MTKLCNLRKEIRKVNLCFFLFVMLFAFVFLNAGSLKAFEEKKIPLILISIDGFRFDYIEKYQPPALLSLIKNGVRAERMQPVYPSKTFPNHISIITGMYPSKHGIVHNSFYDPTLNDVYKMGKAFDNPKWMQGTPLWIHAERHGVKSASYFWPESDSTLEGISASYSYKYNKKTPYGKRIDQIVDWLRLPIENRPQFVTTYFSLVDDNGHDFGPNSIHVKNAVLEVDKHIGNLRNRIENELKIEVNMVIVSDHGMLDISEGTKINWKNLVDFTGFKVVNGTTQLQVYSLMNQNKTELNAFVEALNSKSKGQYIAYLKNDLPKNTHYFGNDRIANIIVEAIAPTVFTNKNDVTNFPKGMHGYDPHLVPEMGAIFIAGGPYFKHGLTIPAFENVHVFPLLNQLLDLPPLEKIDGELEVLTTTLNQK